MKINKSFIRIALATGLIGIAACGGSDSSSNRERNAAIATNVKRYEGTIQVSGRDFGSPTSPDRYTVGFDMNLDVVSTQEFTTGTTTSRGDFRNAFSKFSIEKAPGNQGTLDLSSVKWAQCPYDSYFRTSDTAMPEFVIVFVEAPNPDIASAPCGQPTLREDKYHQAGLWTSNGEYVRPADDARYLTLCFRQQQEIGTEDFPSLVSLLPEGLDPYFDASKNVQAVVGVVPYSLPWDANFALSLSSTKLKDYQPYEFTATPNAATIDLSWKRSADLIETDVVSYDLLWSTDAGRNLAGTVPLEDVTGYTLPGCLLNPQNDLAAGSKVSVRLVAKDPAGIRSVALEKSVSVTADTVQCPTTTPIAAPTGFTVVASQEKITASWTAIENPDPEVAVNYCVSEVNPNLPDPTSDEFALRNDSAVIECTSETTLDIFDIGYENTKETKYFVQVQAASGVLSARSEIKTITTPKQPNVAGLTVSATSEGLNIKWNSSGEETANQVILLFSVDVNMNCDQTFADLKTATKTRIGIKDVMNRIGAVINAETFLLSIDRLGNEFVPGSVLTVCAKRMGISRWSESPDWGIATYTNPSTTDAPVATIAPAVEETAKAAIATATETEVQLPAMDLNFPINLTDVYTGFGVKASDVKSVEYQVADGSWVPLTKDESIKIPKTASKLSVRVTKTNGEKVVSEKAIERTEVTTDTTMAPTDSSAAPVDAEAPVVTEAPVTTEAPESSDSSSSNNILVYIFGIIIVAGGAGFFFKKKSASAK